MDRRHAALICALLTCVSCTRFAAQHAAHVLRIADPSDPSSLNPLLAHDQDTIGFDLLVVQTLVGLSRENRVVPVLVTRVPSRSNGDVSRDGRTIVYHLKHGVRFADGQALSSADVAFTFRAIMDPRNPVQSQDAYRRVAALLTPDPYTVVVRLKAPWNAAVREAVHVRGTTAIPNADQHAGHRSTPAENLAILFHGRNDRRLYGSIVYRWRRARASGCVRNECESDCRSQGDDGKSVHARPVRGGAGPACARASRPCR